MKRDMDTGITCPLQIFRRIQGRNKVQRSTYTRFPTQGLRVTGDGRRS